MMSRPRKRNEDEDRDADRDEIEQPEVELDEPITQEPTEKKVCEIKDLGAMDAESVRMNRNRERTLAARRAGQRVTFNGIFDQKYDDCMAVYLEVLDPTVRIDRTSPIPGRCGSVKGSQARTFDDLDQFVRKYFWKGEDEQFRYTVRGSNGNIIAQGSWTIPMDPNAITTWKERAAEARIISAQQASLVGVQGAPPNSFLRQHGWRKPSEEEDMKSGYWATNGVTAPVFVPEGVPCPPGYGPMQVPVITPPPVVQPAPPSPPTPAGPSPEVVALQKQLEALQQQLVKSEEDRRREVEEQKRREEKAEEERKRREIDAKREAESAAMRDEIRSLKEELKHRDREPARQQDVPVGTIVNGFVYHGNGNWKPQPPAQPQPPAPQAAKPSEVFAEATDMLGSAIKFAKSGGLFPKVDAAREAATAAGPPPQTPPVQPPVQIVELGGGAKGIFNEGKFDWGTTTAGVLIPQLPRIIELGHKAVETWGRTSEANANAEAARAQRDSAALQRAMQVIAQQDQAAAQRDQEIVALRCRSAQREDGAQADQPRAQQQHSCAPQPQQRAQEPKVQDERTQDLGVTDPVGVECTQQHDPFASALRHVSSRRVRTAPSPSAGGNGGSSVDEGDSGEGASGQDGSGGEGVVAPGDPSSGTPIDASVPNS